MKVLATHWVKVCGTWYAPGTEYEVPEKNVKPVAASAVAKASKQEASDNTPFLAEKPEPEEVKTTKRTGRIRKKST